MGGQHIIIRADNADIHRLAIANGRLVLATRCKAMRKVTAA
jgi:hypothetical protein